MMFNDISNLVDNISIPSSSIKIEDKFIDELKKYNKSSNLNNENYRKRINSLYDEIGMLKPIDNELDSVMYFDNYDEVGLVLNRKDISLKQIWTEYRLMYNEKNKEEDGIMKNSFVLDNFDELFEKLSKKVNGVDKHINDLNLLRREIDADNVKLKSSRESLEVEKIKFDNYRREETARLEQLEKELNIKIEKINGLINLFEEKMKGLNNVIDGTNFE